MALKKPCSCFFFNLLRHFGQIQPVEFVGKWKTPFIQPVIIFYTPSGRAIFVALLEGIKKNWGFWGEHL
jgi:hypothetical protein